MDQIIQDVSKRIRGMRESVELAAETVAKKANINIDEYIKYESGELDIPISAVYAIAAALEVDPTLLMTGEPPRMSRYAITRDGKGISVERYKEYSFSALAYNFKNRMMDPMIVELLPKAAPPELVTHSGQEFNYVLEGEVTVLYDDKQFVLKAGDSMYFDPTVPHGQMAQNGYAKFMTVIME